MNAATRSLVIGLVAMSLGLFTVGCEGPRHGSGEGQTLDVISCSACRTVWVDNGKTYETFIEAPFDAVEQHGCATCQTAVENYIRTGNFEHACAQCGDKLGVCHKL